jgi:hypothetical protein
MWRENLMARIEKRSSMAEESQKTKKAREKLQRQLADLEKKITPQALHKKTIEIHRWIERHAPQRVILKNKNISLFDENQNAAALSARVAQLSELLKQ